MNDAPHRPRISVIIPVYRGGEVFRRALTSVVRADPPPDEVIVISDGDDAEDKTGARDLGARVLALPEQSGPAAARNRGAAAATGDLLFFVDADTAIPADALGRIARAFADDPTLDALIGSYDDEPSGTSFLSQYKNLSHHYFHQTSSAEASTFWGACGAIRGRAFEEVGGFDETYRAPCVEDIELGYRLRRAGKRIRLLKTLQVKHLKVWTAGSMLKADLCYRAVPWAELILRYPDLAHDLNLRWSGRAGVVLAYSLMAALPAALVWPAAWWGCGALAGGLLTLNLPFYRFLRRKRGAWFALRSIPWNWSYYLYGGLGFVLGATRHLLLSRAGMRRPEPSVRPEAVESKVDAG
jgi:GT2 family glycosyltransferase